MLMMLVVEVLELGERTRCLIMFIGVGCCCDVEDEEMIDNLIQPLSRGHQEVFIEHGESPTYIGSLLVVGSCAPIYNCRFPSL